MTSAALKCHNTKQFVFACKRTHVRDVYTQRKTCIFVAILFDLLIGRVNYLIISHTIFYVIIYRKKCHADYSNSVMQFQWLYLKPQAWWWRYKLQYINYYIGICVYLMRLFAIKCQNRYVSIFAPRWQESYEHDLDHLLVFFRFVFVMNLCAFGSSSVILNPRRRDSFSTCEYEPEIIRIHICVLFLVSCMNVCT